MIVLEETLRSLRNYYDLVHIEKIPLAKWVIFFVEREEYISVMLILEVLQKMGW